MIETLIISLFIGFCLGNIFQILIRDYKIIIKNKK